MTYLKKNRITITGIFNLEIRQRFDSSGLFVFVVCRSTDLEM